MLMVTYALVTLSVEQKKTRNTLSSLHQQIQNNKSQALDSIDQSSVESLLYQLHQFDETCHWRNVELYVIPALRRVTTDADALIVELESLSSRGEEVLRSIRGQLWQAFEQGMNGISDVCHSMELYCEKLLQRLVKEEEELFPLVQRVISGNEWFEIAAQFISHDAENHTHKPFNLAGRRQTRSATMSIGL